MVAGGPPKSPSVNSLPPVGYGCSTSVLARAAVLLFLCSGWDYRKERGTTINLSDFTRFCTDKFDLRLKAQSLFEPRQRPEIPISRIFLLVVGALALRKQSFSTRSTCSPATEGPRSGWAAAVPWSPPMPPSGGSCLT